MTITKPTPVEWALRVGAFMCFVGHGAFGVITKEAWVPYFAVVGIGRETAFHLMPLVGALDIVMGCLALVRPMPVVFAWMSVWALWTALLRPLSGEPVWETLERAGNYGVPIALLILGAWRPVLGRFTTGPLAPNVVRAARLVLQLTVALLLIGHGALGIIGKQGLTTNLSSAMSLEAAQSVTRPLGWLEIGLAALAFVRIPAVLVVIAVWKVLTEALFVSAGAPIWEWVERGGSYAAPIALAMLLYISRRQEPNPVM